MCNPPHPWQTLAGLVSVMGKPRGHGNWTWDRCLAEQRWAAYLNNTSYSRPGNTGAMVCLFITDQERPAFEQQYGGPILDFFLSRRQQQELYCPKVLEMHAYRGNVLMMDLMQRVGGELTFMHRTGDIAFSPVVPIGALSLNITGFAVGLPILQHALPPNPSEQQADEAVLGAAGANVDLGMIACNVLQNVFAPAPSITFEVYDITDPRGPTMIYGPGPRCVYYRDRDILPFTDISPPNITRPWEERSVVPLDLLGARLRRYQVWCRYVEAPSSWLSWGVPFLWAALALMVTALVAAVAWQQGVGYVRSEESMTAADQLRVKARAAERSKCSFVASMSHELRTPMLGIVGLLDALEDRRLSAAQLHDVRVARASAYDTVRLVNRVLDLSKLEARRMPLCCSPFHPHAWLEEVVLGYCERAWDKGIEVAGMVDTGVPVVLHMDTMRLSQVLNELIDNAMCNTASGHVLVRVSVCPTATSLEDFIRHHLRERCFVITLHSLNSPSPSLSRLKLRFCLPFTALAVRLTFLVTPCDTHCSSLPTLSPPLPPPPPVPYPPLFRSSQLFPAAFLGSLSCTRLSDAPLHHHTPPPPHPWSLSWLACLHTHLGLLVRRAVAVCWGEQMEDQGVPYDREGNEELSQPTYDAHTAVAVLGEEEQVGDVRGEGEGDGSGWRSSGGGGEEMQLVLSCVDTGCGFDASWEELSEFKGRSESGGAGLGFVLVHQLVPHNQQQWAHSLMLPSPHLLSLSSVPMFQIRTMRHQCLPPYHHAPSLLSLLPAPCLHLSRLLLAPSSKTLTSHLLTLPHLTIRYVHCVDAPACAAARYRVSPHSHSRHKV
ncbi:unnamed protein product [Closterium sp. Naga37s-1]|nr:unnamed protein product [Closterium sp. Naga37s-1]